MFDSSWYFKHDWTQGFTLKLGWSKTIWRTTEKFGTFHIFFYSSDMEDLLREERTMFNCHQNKVENIALPKRNDMFWKNKIKTGF